MIAVTLSANDRGWSDLMRILLTMELGRQVTDVEVANLSDRDRYILFHL